MRAFEYTWTVESRKPFLRHSADTTKIPYHKLTKQRTVWLLLPVQLVLGLVLALRLYQKRLALTPNLPFQDFSEESDIREVF